MLLMEVWICFEIKLGLNDVYINICNFIIYIYVLFIMFEKDVKF